MTCSPSCQALNRAVRLYATTERIRPADLEGAESSCEFLFERSIDSDTYDRHAEKLREELTLARIDQSLRTAR